MRKDDRIDEWVVRINQRDLATLGATVARVERVVGDERSSFRQLSEVVLPDAALSAKLLRVANSPSYSVSTETVTTITRATAMIGFDAVRNICITSRLLESLLSEDCLSPAITDRLLNRTAASLHAAAQARMMMAGAETRVREEVFLSALLDQVGESAFWSAGGEQAQALDEELGRPDCVREAAIARVIGGSFRDLSAALVRSWGLGDAIDMARQSDSDEARAIRLANELADVVAVDGWQPSRLEHLNQQIALVMNIGDEDAAHLTRTCGKEAQELAACYGAGLLARRMVKRVDTPAAAAEPVAVRRTPAPPDEPLSRGRANSSLQSKAMRELAALAGTKPDINTVLQVAMEGVQTGIGMDRTIAALLTPDRSTLQTRLWLGSGGKEWSSAFRFAVPAGKNIFHECVANLAFYRFNSAAQGSLLRLIPRELLQFCEGRDFLLAPIVVGSRSIGVLYADRTLSGRAVSEDDFAAFRLLDQQLGNCLASLTQRKS